MHLWLHTLFSNRFPSSNPRGNSTLGRHNRPQILKQHNSKLCVFHRVPAFSLGRDKATFHSNPQAKLRFRAFRTTKRSTGVTKPRAFRSWPLVMLRNLDLVKGCKRFRTWLCVLSRFAGLTNKMLHKKLPGPICLFVMSSSSLCNSFNRVAIHP